MIYGITKGTDFEKLCEGAAKAEAAGVMMYYALARMAREQGYPEEVAEKFIEFFVGSGHFSDDFLNGRNNDSLYVLELYRRAY